MTALTGRTRAKRSTRVCSHGAACSAYHRTKCRPARGCRRRPGDAGRLAVHLECLVTVSGSPWTTRQPDNPTPHARVGATQLQQKAYGNHSLSGASPDTTRHNPTTPDRATGGVEPVGCCRVVSGTVPDRRSSQQLLRIPVDTAICRARVGLSGREERKGWVAGSRRRRSRSPRQRRLDRHGDEGLPAGEAWDAEEVAVRRAPLLPLSHLRGPRSAEKRGGKAPPKAV